VNKTQLFQEIDRILAINATCPLLAFTIKAFKWRRSGNPDYSARVEVTFKFNGTYNKLHCTYNNESVKIIYLFGQDNTCSFKVFEQTNEVIVDEGIKSLIEASDVSDRARYPKTWEDGLTSILELIDLYRQVVQQACRSLDGPLNDAYQQLNV